MTVGTPVVDNTVRLAGMAQAVMSNAEVQPATTLVKRPTRM